MKQTVAIVVLGLAGSACPPSVVEDCDRDPLANLSVVRIELSAPVVGFGAHDQLAAVVATDAGLAVEVPGRHWLVPLTRGHFLVGYWNAAGGLLLADPTHLYLATPQETKPIIELRAGLAGTSFSQAGVLVVEGGVSDQTATIHLVASDLQSTVLERSVPMNPKLAFPVGSGYCVQEYLRSRDGGTGTNQIRCDGKPVLQGPTNALNYKGIRTTNRHILYQTETGHTAVRIADKLELPIDIPPVASRFLGVSDSCGFLFAESDAGTGRIRYWNSQTESVALDHQLLDTPLDAVSSESRDGIYVRSGSQLILLKSWGQ